MKALLITAIAAATASAVPRAPHGPVVFGDTAGCIIMDREGHVVRRLQEVCGLVATDFAVSPDLKGFEDAQAVWGADLKTVLYQRDGAVWCLTLGARITERRAATILGEV